MTASETSRWATGGRSNSPDATAGRDPPLLRLELLGGFRVTLGDQVIEEPAWRLRKARSLVKLLALAPEHVLHRDQLLDVLWPNLDPDAAANNLRYTLHVTRGVLQAAAPTRLRVLETLGERLALYPAGPIWVDVDAFERAAAGARRTTDPAAYHAAIDVYAGDLLPDDRYEDWAAKRREALRTTCLALLVDVAWLHETREEHAPAIAALVRAIALEPAHEQAHVGLMRLYALAGQRTQALRQYRQLQAALRDELDAEPEPASQELYAEIVAGRFPAAGRQPARGAMQPIVADRRQNLPIHPTRFMAAVASWWR